MFLTPAELVELTGKRTRPAQVKALRYMGVEHRIRADGMAIVARSHIEKILDGNIATHKMEARIEPDWNAIA